MTALALSCWLLLGLIVAQATGARGIRRCTRNEE